MFGPNHPNRNKFVSDNGPFLGSPLMVYMGRNLINSLTVLQKH